MNASSKTCLARAKCSSTYKVKNTTRGLLGRLTKWGRSWTKLVVTNMLRHFLEVGMAVQLS